VFKDVCLETDRLFLRALRLDDAHAIHVLVADPNVMKYLPGDMMSLKQVTKAIAWLLDCYERNTPERIIKFTVAIMGKETGQVIGWCGLGPLDVSPEDVELFYGLSKAYWRKGLATEAASAMLEYGFGTIGLDKTVAVVGPENVASKRVIEKLGMVYEKTLRNVPKEHKSYEGDLYYSLTNEAWHASRAKPKGGSVNPPAILLGCASRGCPEGTPLVYPACLGEVVTKPGLP
jgi:ribosomal-protein-alanine N-acetyltransferase